MRSLASVGNCSAKCGVRPTSAQAAGTGLPIAAPAAAGHPVITFSIHPIFSDFKRQFPVRSFHMRHYLTHRRDHAGISRFRNAARAEKSAKDLICVMPDRDPATAGGIAGSRRERSLFLSPRRRAAPKPDGNFSRAPRQRSAYTPRRRHRSRSGADMYIDTSHIII